MIKVIIFDMDGVIVDSEPLWGEMEFIFLGKKGFRPTQEYVRYRDLKRADKIVKSLKEINLKLINKL